MQFHPSLFNMAFQMLRGGGGGGGDGRNCSLLLVTTSTYLMVVLWMLMMIVGGSAASRPCFPALFPFGDSYSDTGNAPLAPINYLPVLPTMLPYGETFPGTPFNRFSDGRLKVDFLANYLGLPFVNPYLNASADFTTGVNYAFSGATALEASYLQSLFNATPVKYSLDRQLAWHLSLKANVESTNSTVEGKPSLASLADGLYWIEIGRNDYAYAFESNYTLSYINTTFVQLVIQKIRNATETLYHNGARKFILFSILPMGCSPSLLATHLTDRKDSDGCLPEYNSITYNHGVKLLAEVENLRTTYRDATFLFADYYGAYTYVLRNKLNFGFLDGFDACCGAGPSYPYNYYASSFCRNATTSLCPNPNTYINWDGVHFTDKFSFQIAKETFISGSYLNPMSGLASCS